MPPQYRSRVSNTKGKAGARDYSEATAQQIDEEVRRLMDDAYHLARATFIGNREKLEVLAKSLLKYETFDGSRIKEIVKHGHQKSRPPRGVPPAPQENAGGKPAWFIGSHRARNGGSDLDRTR